MIKNIVFDVGRVLVEFDWQRVFKDLGFPEDIFEQVANATVRSQVWNEFDRSEASNEEILKGFLANAPEREQEILKFWDHIGDTIVRYDYSMDWIQELKEKGYRVYLLSNYPERTYIQSLEELAFVNEVDGAVFSYQVKFTKPEPEIYQELFTRYGLEPQECVFLDDSEPNIIAAKKLGMEAVHFQNKEQAEAELKKLGIE